ncbi:uncharacterized protein VTP21DRAFT_10504 [Calcarisporiella thermophila]|uniref:uncharacterized protein n=1 Tax=Calcarisporiella thermophila TaxID=911321 RepID=UPI003742F394
MRLLYLLAAAAVGVAASDVLSLTQANFKEVVDGEKIIMVKFYDPSCKHCTKMMPEYERAATLLKKSSLPLATVNCVAERSLCEEFEVTNFPTIKLFKEESDLLEFNGQLKTDAFVRYMKRHTLPPLSDLDTKLVDSFIKLERVAVVGFLSESDKEEREAIELLANDLRNDFIFGVTSSPEAAEKYGVKSPSVVLFKTFDEGRSVFEGDFNSDQLTRFVRLNALPLLDEMTPENYDLYIDSEYPLAHIFIDSDESRRATVEALLPVARELRGRVNFGWIDVRKYDSEIYDSLALKPKWPALAIQNVTDSLKYPFDQTKELTTEAVREYAEKFLAHELAPALRSQPIPEKNDGPTKIVVADEYDSIVGDDTKDVFVLFYDPECGYSRRVMPSWEKLGQLVREGGNKNTVIAKMDAVVNDIPVDAPYEIFGYPTIKLFKAKTGASVEGGEKEPVSDEREIVDFNEEDRNLGTLVRFLKANAAHGLEVVGEVPEVWDVPEEPSAEESEQKEEEGKKKEEEEKLAPPKVRPVKRARVPHRHDEL